MKRIFLLILTNFAVLFVLSISMQLLGIDRMLAQETGLNLQGLLLMAAIFGFGGAFISLAISKWMAKMATGAQVIEVPSNMTERWLLDTVKRQADKAGVGMPEVAVYDSPDINAFATGWNRNSALVAVSTGLLQNMTQEEAEAVLGHEMSHVANGDMVTLTLIQGVLNTFVIFLSRVVGFLVDRVLLRNERGYGIGYWVTTIVAELVLGILAAIIVAWFSRQREFRADAGGAALAGREKMIAALERLKLNQEQSQLPAQISAFGISGGGGIMRLMMSHPPLDERIIALREAPAPGRPERVSPVRRV
ncbi:MAG: zinc metalloprotease HtpX [Betaproteobacteria bacterium RIFCSPLOWO2_02_FULL_67_26]|nr:MAG: zinc metalloprotease HtpX [Betaproteobacteria bacterium RIFCSPLOWO2_02_FULL_67_26]